MKPKLTKIRNQIFNEFKNNKNERLKNFLLIIKVIKSKNYY